jgi:D-threo-aldose 1-dehydrogenase
MSGRPLPRRPDVGLSMVGFGGAPIGNLYVPVADDLAQESVATAWTAGVRYFDTAPHYGLGLSEVRLGAALHERPRGEFLLSSKVGRLLVPAENTGRWPEAGQQPQGWDSEGFAVPATHVRQRDYSADGVRRSLEQSLVRLGLDRIDVVYVHDPDEHWDEASKKAIPALCELREQGVISAVGVGMNQSAMLTRFVVETDIDVVMCAGRFSLLEQPALVDLLPAAQQHRVGVVCAGVFNSGLLAHVTPPEDARYDYQQATATALDRARRIAAVCRHHATTLPAAAVHYPLAHPAVTSVVLGMATPGEVEADIALLHAPPPPQLWADLVSQGLLDPLADPAVLG